MTLMPSERKLITNADGQKNDDETKEYYAQIRGISAQMKPIRDKLKIAKPTLETVPKVQQLLDIERNMEEKILTKKKEEKVR